MFLFYMFNTGTRRKDSVLWNNDNTILNDPFFGDQIHLPGEWADDYIFTQPGILVDNRPFQGRFAPMPMGG